MTATLHDFLGLSGAIDGRVSRSSRWFWLSLSLTIAAIYGLLALRQAFSSDYLVDSDARQHVYWMQRFLDPDLFPNDLITDYHQSVAPAGYAAVYRLFAVLGIDPLRLNKVVPPVLGIVTTAYCFAASLRFIPIPFTAFLSTLLLNQALWLRYDLISGTPRAFMYALFLAFLYYLLRRSLIPCLIAVVLQGLFYPQCVFVTAAILALYPLRWQKGRIGLDRHSIRFAAAGLTAALVVMLPYALQSSEFGPSISRSEARSMVEFSPQGRTPFWVNNPLQFWLYGSRSSLLPQPGSLPPLIWVSLALPFILPRLHTFPLGSQVKNSRLLGIGVIASVVMWAIAHLLLFHLHLPSRYTQHTLPILLSLAGAIALTLVLDWLLRAGNSVRTTSGWTRYLATALVGLAVLSLVALPLFVPFPYHKYKQGEAPQLYEFLQQQPKETIVASLSEEANNIPTFGLRSVLVSEMYAIPYHVGYYRQIRQRTIDLMTAQYSPDPAVLQEITQQYDIDFWLLDRAAFKPDYVSDNAWLMQYPPAQSIIRQLKQQQPTAISQFSDRCAVLKNKDFWLLDAACILRRE